MPPPSLLSRTITSGRPSRRAASSPPMSWASATSPISSTVGPGPAAATPNAVETVPSIPLAPRLESTRGGASRAGKKVSTSRTGIEEATTSVASPGSRTPSSAATRGSERSPSVWAIASAACVVGAAPGVEPVAVLARLLRRQHARVGGHDRADAARRVLPRGLGVEGDLERVEAVEPLAQRLRGGEVAEAQDEVGGVGGGEAGSRRSAS